MLSGPPDVAEWLALCDVGEADDANPYARPLNPDAITTAALGHGGEDLLWLSDRMHALHHASLHLAAADGVSLTPQSEAANRRFHQLLASPALMRLFGLARDILLDLPTRSRREKWRWSASFDLRRSRSGRPTGGRRARHRGRELLPALWKADWERLETLRQRRALGAVRASRAVTCEWAARVRGFHRADVVRRGRPPVPDTGAGDAAGHRSIMSLFPSGTPSPANTPRPTTCSSRPISRRHRASISVSTLRTARRRGGRPPCAMALPRRPLGGYADQSWPNSALRALTPPWPPAWLSKDLLGATASAKYQGVSVEDGTVGSLRRDPASPRITATTSGWPRTERSPSETKGRPIRWQPDEVRLHLGQDIFVSQRTAVAPEAEPRAPYIRLVSAALPWASAARWVAAWPSLDHGPANSRATSSTLTWHATRPAGWPMACATN